MITHHLLDHALFMNNNAKGIILNPDYTKYSEFPINCGVKQGGILSPYLFNIFLNDLLEQCTEAQVGAIFNEINFSIIVYADDIILISQHDQYLQILLNICSEYSEDWLIKFKSNKSHIISFGKPFLRPQKFSLNQKELYYVDKTEFLGIEIPNDLNFNKSIAKLNNVRKSIFSLSYLGLTPN